jgi:hypothetical protein
VTEDTVIILVQLQMGFGLVIRLIEHVQNVTTNNYDTLSTHRNYSTHTVFLVSHSRCLVTASTGRCSPYLGSRTVSGNSYQLLTETVYRDWTTSSSLTWLISTQSLTNRLHSESESELFWWFTANQFVLVPSPLRIMTRNITVIALM